MPEESRLRSSLRILCRAVANAGGRLCWYGPDTVYAAHLWDDVRVSPIAHDHPQAADKICPHGQKNVPNSKRGKTLRFVTPDNYISMTRFHPSAPDTDGFRRGTCLFFSSHGI